MIKLWSTRFLGRFFSRRSAGRGATQLSQAGSAWSKNLLPRGGKSPHASDGLEKSAADGNALDQNRLGLMLAFGEGALKNVLEARRWFRRAADQGDASAQFNLGNLCHPANLENAVGDAQEARIEAYMWFYLASAQGHGKAGALCEMLNLNMTDAELCEGNRRAAAFRAKREAPAELVEGALT